MSIDYAAIQAQATAALVSVQSAGSPAGAHIRRMETIPGGDPWNPTLAPVYYQLTVVVTEFSAREIDGTLIQTTDKKVLVAAGGLSITPTTGDALIIGGTLVGDEVTGGKLYQAARVEPLQPAPGGPVVLYTITARA